MPLEGWQVRPETTGVKGERAEISNPKASEWYPIRVDDSWEKTLGVDFDGRATYRTDLPNLEGVLNPDKRLILHFGAVATLAKVFVDEAEVGEHLGGWTPFRFDITEFYRPGAKLEVVVEELVGHNTQGFLPVFLPHAGGIWQPVSLMVVDTDAYIDDLSLFVGGWIDDSIDLEIPLVWGPSARFEDFSLGVRPIDAEMPFVWQQIASEDQASRVRLTPAAGQPWPKWSPENPQGVTLEIVVRHDPSGSIRDRWTTQAYNRRVEAVGREIHLNGRPITPRGVLNWGYAPPRLTASLDRDWMKQELSFIKERGFNLMKFCLWIPPREYLQLCDEMGILAWVEYPTWHPKLTPDHLPDLMREYMEFFHHDRNHPSVILRSLTCETGHSADLAVIEQLYLQAKEAIPGSLIEDDSSWISWQRVFDFYDDHPYGNNHTWKETLERLDTYISQREPKPLVLGEAIAADTWPDLGPNPMPQPPHALISHGETESTRRLIEELCGNQSDWIAASFRHADQTRKFQIERFRHQLPRQGYTVSVLRDFPFASMGLIDFANRPKSTAESWAWHGESMICLETPQDSRSFEIGQTVPLMFHLVEPRSGSQRWSWEVNGRTLNELTFEMNAAEPPALHTVESKWFVDSAVEVPTRVTLRSVWETLQPDSTLIDGLTSATTGAAVANSWDCWLVPKLPLAVQTVTGFRHVSAVDLPLGKELDDFFSQPWDNSRDPSSSIVLASSFDLQLFEWLCQGGRIVMLPDGSPGSFPIADHWFLRGGPVVNAQGIGDGPLSEMIQDLQAFDLAGPIMKSPDYLAEVTPWVLLWDNHDTADYRIHAVCWGTNVQRGRLWVSTLASSPDRGAACSAVLRHAMKCLSEKTFPHSFSVDTIERIRSDLGTVRLEVPRSDWSFKPDPDGVGLKENWHFPNVDREQWDRIAIAQHWDGQGYQALDGWAWYAKKLSIPPEARYLIFTGVDDYFEVFINGQFQGAGGNRERRQTAFDLTISIPFPEDLGSDADVVIRVEDWQGAGGIFRPVYFSSQPHPDKPAILRHRDWNFAESN